MVGIGLRAPHYGEILERRPAAGFLEVHSENFFAAGGADLAWLERFRALYPLSLHGVGLSLGSADALDERHLAKLEALVERVAPMLVSEHLSWSSFGGRHANDLLPLPYTQEALDLVCARVGALTIEHNYEVEKRESIRKLMEAKGYVRVRSWEVDDWYVHRDLARQYIDLVKKTRGTS